MANEKQIWSLMRSNVIKFARPNHTPEYVTDSAEANTVGIESKAFSMAAVVQSIMMMAVENLAHAKAAC